MTTPRYTLSDESIELTRTLADKCPFVTSKHSLSVFVNIIYRMGLLSLQAKIFDLNGVFLGEPLLDCLQVPEEVRAEFIDNLRTHQALLSNASSEPLSAQSEPSYTTITEQSDSKASKRAHTARTTKKTTSTSVPLSTSAKIKPEPKSNVRATEGLSQKTTKSQEIIIEDKTEPVKQATSSSFQPEFWSQFKK